MTFWRWMLLFAVVQLFVAPSSHAGSYEELAADMQPPLVKIYGVGGLQGLEAYQSGFIASAEGHIVTAQSLVLDQGRVTVVLHDGRRLQATVLGSDPVTEIAVLKLEAENEEFPLIDLSASGEPREGTRVLAFSNLFGIATGDEPVSMLQGVVTAIAPLSARRGAFDVRYKGEVLIVDANSNNPGAAGGLLTDQAGRPLGMLGKEIRSQVTGTWLHYALPLRVVATCYDDILAGRQPAVDPDELLPEHPASLAVIGLRLVPNVVPRTPPYVDSVAAGSPAEQAGLQPDDLLLAISGVTTGSVAEVQSVLARTEQGTVLLVTALRSDEVIDVEITVPPAN